MSTETYQWRYTLELREPVVVSTLRSSGIAQATSLFIPGSLLLGAFAAAFMTHRGLRTEDAHRDVDFRRLFLRGGLRFLNAYPTLPGEPGVRLLPVPLSFFQSKSDETTAIDRAVEGSVADTAIVEGTRSLQGYCVISGDSVTRWKPRTRLNHHTQIDRTSGRTRSGEGPYVYESLIEGQMFGGLILGSREYLGQIASIVPRSIALGRSRSAQYGTVELHADNEPTPFRSEIPGDELVAQVGPPTVEEPLENDGGLVLTLTADLIPPPSPVADGHATLEFPFEELAEFLGTDPTRLREECRSFCRLTHVGGYSGTWRMPKGQVPALLAGSVFVFPSVERAPIDLESHSLGQRVGEGFGRFVANWHQGGRFMIAEPDRGSPRRPAAEAPRAVKALVETVTANRVEDLAVRRAMSTHLIAVPPNATLARLAALFRDTPPGEALGTLEQWSHSSKAIGRSLRMFRRKGDGRLFADVIREWAESNPASEFELSLVKARQGIGLDMPKIGDEEVRAFALALLDGLRARRKRESRNT